MTARPLPSPELLCKLLRYEPETGKLFWRERSADMFKTLRDCNAWNVRYAEKEAFTAETQGYKTGAVFNRRHLAHRVIWAMQTGAWPEDQIDHVNRNALDNRFDNLRAANSAQNSVNRASRKGSRSRYLGVSWSGKTSKWLCQLCSGGKSYYLGLYLSEVEAARAYDTMAQMVHGDFARLNFPEACRNA